MALIIEDDGQYYAGEQYFTGQTAGGSGANKVLPATTFNTNLVSAYNSSSVQIGSSSNFEVYFKITGASNYKKIREQNLTVSNNVITVIFQNLVYSDNSQLISGGAIPAGDYYVKLKSSARADNYGNYQYIKLDDIVNNFIVAYVGFDKLIKSVKRTDIIFHAKRGLQEFSYDTLKSIKSQELTIPASLSVPFPKDYVNYVKVSWIDGVGAKHIIYPTRVTSNPTEIYIQDSDGEAVQDDFGNNTLGSSNIDSRYAAMRINPDATSSNDYRYTDKVDMMLGQRYGLTPEEANVNGKFTINEREGTFSFSSVLVNKLILLEYITDNLGYDADIKVPKFAEQAMYMHIAYSILASRSNVPEYLVNRFKKDRRTALRNAKIRLSNIKLEEISQVFRNRSKQIKH